MMDVEALIGGSILAFWGLALVTVGLAMASVPSRRRGLTLLGKCGVALGGLGFALMVLGFHVMGGA